ncbi:arginine N-methyltransferase 2 [Rhizodiscina lignyota]|uniref:Arginine N-methyltransferase 2 n=1 Tax=Rhizodiscina lignyota TaxID=1504668 RepID=A0A9P4MF21_9PEZI|nr:arginine N-methyltransferase 2 [Rhizodiscina lignyota]
MEPQEATEEDILLAQRIISAASRHDLAALQILLKDGSANVQDPTTGTTPLHAAIAACTPNDAAETNVDEGKGKAKGSARTEEGAVKIVEELLQNGAIWNDLNKDNETPGCVAHRLGLMKLYQIMVEAGVRAELLFSKMDELDLDETDNEPAIIPKKNPPIQGLQESEQIMRDGEDDDVSLDNHAYLKSKLRFQPGILLDESHNAVMMDWETAIMTRHAETLLPSPGLRAMNVGHGMGIVDRAIQERKPKEHHIVEAHPQVLEKMRKEGWMDKPGVRVWEGRWQDVLPRMVEQGVLLDGIYYDTFAEDYKALREFFSEWVVQLLDPSGGVDEEGGLFGWYNGLGADRQICYDVYTKVAEMDLYEAGFDTKWEDIAVPESLHGSEAWKGTRRPYWALDVYRLPVNTFIK